LRQALQQLARLLEIPHPETSIETAKSEAHALTGETSKSFDQARRYVELTRFEFEESPSGERTSLGNLEETLSRAEEMFVAATSLAGEQPWNDWQQLPATAKIAESELRNAVAKRVERAATNDAAKEVDGTDLSTAFARWNQTTLQLSPDSSRAALVSQIAAEGQHL